MRSLLAGLRELVLPAGAGPGDPAIVLGPNVPAELQAHYGGDIVAAAIWRHDIGNYQYRAVRTTMSAVVEGVVLAAAFVHEQARYNIEAGIPIIRWGEIDPGTFTFGSSVAAGISNVNFTIDSLFHIQGGWLCDSVPVGRGLKVRIDSAAASAAIGAEAIVLTTGAMTFKDGRAYRVRWSGRNNPSGANTTSYRVRQTNLAGASLGFFQEVFTSAVGRHLYGVCYVKRTAGSGDLSDNLVLTLQASAGTNVMTAAADTVRFLEVEDCGEAARYVNAIAI